MLGDSVNAIDEFNEDAVEDLLEDGSEAPFIRLVNDLARVVRAGASDIHIEPYRDVSAFPACALGWTAYRYERLHFERAHHAAVVSRIKVMANPTSRKSVCRRTGVSHFLGGRQAGLRVSTLPTSSVSAWCSVCSKKRASALLTESGLSWEDLQLMHFLWGSRHRRRMVTGPTGSGKTTTLYAVLQELTAPDKNILTISKILLNTNWKAWGRYRSIPKSG